ncbi:MAG: hypothetical protein B6I24_03400 [Bacteroidetes bacterium 4572_128]|nr:MAG: hypothetical protein B6I24_03400 [Bacteroidetes bacterium 4572_128]
MIINFFENLDIYSWEIITLLIFAGFCVGIINTLAGSGSIISYYLFMLLGLPAGVANGTFRLGVIFQTLAAAINYKKQKVLDIKKSLILSIPITLGSMLGAEIAVNIREDIFEKIVGIIMLVLLFFIFYKPKNWINGNKKRRAKKTSFLEILIFFCIGIYGGFIHIGVGIFLLAALVLYSGYDLVKANAIKITVVFIYTPFAISVFIFNDKISYFIGLIAAIGNIFGGIIASYFAVNFGAKFIQLFLVIVIILFVMKLFLF